MKTIKLKLSQRQLNTFLIKMIDNNEIEGLLPAKVMGDVLFVDVDGLTSLSEKYKAKVSFQQIKEIICKIKDRVDIFKQYMIYEDNLLMSIDYIYFDSEDNIFLIPNLQSEQAFDIKTLFNEIMNTCNIEINTDISTLIEVNNYFNTLNYSINGVFNKFFTKDKKNIVKHDTILDNTINEASHSYSNDTKNKKEKTSLSQQFLGFFKKKPYKVKSLDIDFKLPKNN